MKKLQLRKKSCLALVACLALAPAVLSCTERVEHHVSGVHAFVVKVVPANGTFGSDAQPLTFPTAFTKTITCDPQLDAPCGCPDGLDSCTVCPDGEVCYGVHIGAYAVDIEGNFIPNYTGDVALTAAPGSLSKEVVRFENGVFGSWNFENGVPTTLNQGEFVQMRFTHGKMRLWVEDAIRVKREEAADPWCSLNNFKISEDGIYCEPTYATGVSEEFTFEPQTIKMIQYNPDLPAGDSALLHNYGQINALPGHDIVVTNVVSSGFYITDLGDEDYNSLFIFTFSQPSRVEVGDRICEVSGGVSEFTGMTQLQFPSWGIQNKERSTAEDIDPAPEDGDEGVGSCIDKETGLTRPCTDEELKAMAELVDCSNVYYDRELTKEEKKSFAYIAPPEPRVLSMQMLNEANVTALERLEAAVVTIQDIRLSTEFVNCDDNGNGKIESGTEESDCRSACTNSTLCTELSNLESYDQWRAWTIVGNADVSVASSALIAGFSILEECQSWTDPTTARIKWRCPERHLKRLTGNLKQVLPGCAGRPVCNAADFRMAMVMTVIEPRFSTDLIMDDAYNAQSKMAFDQCWADDRLNGCRDACKRSGHWCTCEAFANYRAEYGDAADGMPMSCPNS